MKIWRWFICLRIRTGGEGLMKRKFIYKAKIILANRTNIKFLRTHLSVLSRNRNQSIDISSGRVQSPRKSEETK